MAENKTKATASSVEAFLDRIPNATRRQDAHTVLRMLKGITRQPPKMWGPGIVGFGSYHYKYASGREGDMPMAGFSPRAAALTIYLVPAFDGYRALIASLGKCKTSVSCLYVNKLADVDVKVLRQLLTASYRHLKTHGLSYLGDQASKPRSAVATKPRPRR